MSIQANRNEKYMWMPQVGIKHVHQDNYGFDICECLPTVSQSFKYNSDGKMSKSRSLPSRAFY